MHPNFIGGNPYAFLGLNSLAPYVGGPEASRGMISQGVGFNPAYGPHQGANPFAAPTGMHPLAFHPAMAQNPLLQQLIQRQAAAHYPHMVVSQPARKSGNSLGVNVTIVFNSGTYGGTSGGYTATSFPAAGVAGSATQTLQSEFHGLKLSASASYSGYYSGSGQTTVIYGQQSSGLASDVLLQGVFVGGFNAQPLPPGTAINDGGVALASFPPNGLGNGIDMLPGKVGQVVKCPLLVMPSAIATLTAANVIPAGNTVTITAANIFLTFFGDNLQ